VIPSGIRCTHASTIARCFSEIGPIGVITTKSISLAPRTGYREPIYARYAHGCYINAVGLANPGAESFLAEFEGLEIPSDKFLLVSLFGADVASYVEAARILRPIADGFELNMSCPHAKGYGIEIGQDTELLQAITAAVVEATGVPVIVKLSATLPGLDRTAQAAIDAGATGLTLINTIGPALAAVRDVPILHNKLGGLSGDGIRPLGLRAVRQVRNAVGPGPLIIGMGGIASAEHVRQYRAAGADLFGVGSALTGMDSARMREYFNALQQDLSDGTDVRSGRNSCEALLTMDYVPARVAASVFIKPTLFKLVLESLPGNYSHGDLAGLYFFLCIPGVGEKPFAILSGQEKSIIVRVVGEFTRHLAALQPGAELLLRGPYGRPFPKLEDRALVLVGGGTGIASLLEIAHRCRNAPGQTFLLGARSQDEFFELERFRELGSVLLATDDGTLGFHGYVSELLREFVAKIPAKELEKLTFINCGPEPMVWECFSIEKAIVSHDRIFGSIEYMTSCGVGICGKCASPSGALTCIDGPFLPLAEFQARRRGSTSTL
jgi:dihydroorotate dehydrogenase (NAD+) catalytic subunit